MEYSSQYETITPQKAHEYLENCHVVQRPINKARVAGMVRAILAGKWLPNNDAISFDVDGKVLNGQHRLQAIELSQTPVTALVVRGLPVEAYTVIDRNGLPKRAKDIDKFFGVRAVPMSVEGAIVMEHLNFTASSVARTRLTPDERRELRLACPYTNLLIDLLNAGRGITRPHQPFLAGALRCLKDGDPAIAEKFFTAAFSNTHSIDGKHDSSAQLLANTIIESLTSKQRNSQNYAAHAWKTIRAYNAHVSGEKLVMLRYYNYSPMPIVCRP